MTEKESVRGRKRFFFFLEKDKSEEVWKFRNGKND